MFGMKPVMDLSQARTIPAPLVHTSKNGTPVPSDTPVAGQPSPSLPSGSIRRTANCWGNGLRTTYTPPFWSETIAPSPEPDPASITRPPAGQPGAVAPLAVKR